MEEHREEMENAPGENEEVPDRAVSYTHLTLPTIDPV